MPEREEYSQKRCGMECKGASLVNFELYETIYSTGRHFFGAIELLLVSQKPSLHDEQVHWSCVVRTGDPLCAKTLSGKKARTDNRPFATVVTCSDYRLRCYFTPL